MASHKVFVVIAFAAIIFPALASAAKYIVGDETGWTNGFNYTTWASGKEFHVGDELLFNYPAGKHNVFKVNGTQFKNCEIPPLNEALTSGKDVIPLAKPGKKWYICGVAKHCAEGGQKLVINVLPAVGAPAPSPLSPAPPTSGSAKGTLASGLMAAALVAIAMVAVL
ncbi:hypothetical protein Syun_014891 [Stephania yunnanensis]|uniref:Phytocyanin domain-containing protein n=1 Tax=Stephania yunnanensis TaxID=152371 RepID=A0AAP0JK60_9MAGN